MDCLIVIDFQERLARHIENIDEILKNSVKLVEAFKVFGIPILLTEQEKLGGTVEEIREVLEVEPIKKKSFSCLGSLDFYKEFKKINPKRVALIGIETHICVLQTAIDLIKEGCEVYVAIDCTGSRRSFDKEIAIMRMMQEGVKLSTAESLIYEIMRTAEFERFKEILNIVKG